MNNKVHFIEFAELSQLMKKTMSSCGAGDYIGPHFGISKGTSVFGKDITNHFAPMRVNGARIGVIEKGWVEITVNLNKLRFSSSDLIFINSGAILESESCADDTVTKGFIMAEEYMKLILGRNVPALFKVPGKCASVHLEQQELDLFDYYLNLLINLASSERHNPSATVDSLFLSVLRYIETLCKRKMQDDCHKVLRQKELSESFLILVMDYAKEERNLAFYASKLCITPHYLNILVKNETGETPKDLIDKHVASELQLEIRYGQDSIKKLTEKYHFKSTSALCKFFKRVTGIYPKEFKSNSDTKGEPLSNYP